MGSKYKKIGLIVRLYGYSLITKSFWSQPSRKKYFQPNNANNFGFVSMNLSILEGGGEIFLYQTPKPYNQQESVLNIFFFRFNITF